MIDTTNAFASLLSRLPKIITTRGHFSSDDAATKLLWLALRNITADWGRVATEWKQAVNQLAVAYRERFRRHPKQYAAGSSLNGWSEIEP